MGLTITRIETTPIRMPPGTATRDRPVTLPRRPVFGREPDWDFAEQYRVVYEYEEILASAGTGRRR